MTSQSQPFREPLRNTLLRTGIIAIAVGGGLTLWRGGLARWPLLTLLVFWPSFGGHWVEIFFRNWLRPRLAGGRSVQMAARLVVWFVGGTLLALGMGLTATAVAGIEPARWPAWWIGGLAFIGIELAVHLAMQMRGLPNFYNGRG